MRFDTKVKLDHAAEVIMSPQKSVHHFAVTLVMVLFALLPFRLNPESFTTIDVAAVIVFGLLAAFLVVLGVLGLRRVGSI